MREKVIPAKGYSGKHACVTILTDKWDHRTFHKYEPVFLNYALNDGIDFAFYLATDYGITEIPFLDRFNTEMLRRQYEGKVVFGADDGRRTARNLGLDGFSYEYQGALGAEDYGKSYRYEFDAYRLEWYWENSDGDAKYGRIPDAALKDLLMEVWSILEEYFQDEHERQIDRFMTIEFPGAHRILKIGGFEIDFTDKFMKEKSSEKIMDTKRALDRFIDACLKQEVKMQ